MAAVPTGPSLDSTPHYTQIEKKLFKGVLLKRYEFSCFCILFLCVLFLFLTCPCFVIGFWAVNLALK
jgi:hypothetical protein